MSCFWLAVVAHANLVLMREYTSKYIIAGPCILDVIDQAQHTCNVENEMNFEILDVANLA